MLVFQAIVLGVIEGVTEFLPISSTGHLIVAAEFMNYRDSAKIFTVVIQMGAIGAVIWNYRHDLIQRTTGLINGEKGAKHFWKVWVLATIPGGFSGFLIKDSVSVYAVATTVAIALIIGGIAIWLIETYHDAAKNRGTEVQIDRISTSQAIRIGLFQVLALIPGVSRSGSTIMGGLLTGLDRVTATAFSFYLSIPILVLAGSYQLLKARDEISTVQGGVPALLIGTAAAFITALFAIKWLLRYVSRHDFKLFAYYRIILGLIILAALVIG